MLRIGNLLLLLFLVLLVFQRLIFWLLVVICVGAGLLNGIWVHTGNEVGIDIGIRIGFNHLAILLRYVSIFVYNYYKLPLRVYT